MENIFKDVQQIADQVYRVLGEKLKNLVDENMIFEMVEEREKEPSEVRVADIVSIIIQNYADDNSTASYGLNNNLEVKNNGSNLKSVTTDSYYNGSLASIDHHSLVQHLSSMFPETPLDYIWDKSEDLVGKPAAIERFTNQLLESPHPSKNWRMKLLTLECECCYDDVQPAELIHCPSGHTFCKACIKTATNVALGEGKVVIRCMAECSEEVNWLQLRRALEPNILSKLEMKRQAEEVSAAGLDSLVACPFCPYHAVMEDPSDKVLICRNPECGKNSCRLCKQKSHIPLRCDELPTVEGTRKKIEEELSMAMLRECWKCNKKFFKEKGCNRMTCPCGAQMCYICKARLTKKDDHFYSKEGMPTEDRFCPMYADMNALHKKEVTTAAAKAKKELELDSHLSKVLSVDVEEGKILVDGASSTL